jgi:hypothetical protein
VIFLLDNLRVFCYITMSFDVNIIIVGLIFDMFGAVHLALPIFLRSKKQIELEMIPFPWSENPYIKAAFYEEKEYIKFGSLLLLAGFLGQFFGQLKSNVTINIGALTIFLAILIVYFFAFNKWLRLESNRKIPKEFKKKYGER